MTSIPALIPQPVELKITEGSFQLQPDAVIAYADGNAKKMTELLAAQLRPATGFELPVQEEKGFGFGVRVPALVNRFF